MSEFCSQYVELRDVSQIGGARRMAIALGQRVMLGEVETGKLGIIATEIANNICKHADTGLLICRRLSQGNISGVELLGVDRGPGMQNVEQCLRDGYSTAGTAGHGLGSITRLSSEWDIYSLPGWGTIVMARVWARPLPPQSRERLDVGGICLPVEGESVSGDGWGWLASPVEYRIFTADGLGHGPQANEASAEALRVFEQHGWEAPVTLMNREHNALRKTRGAAIALAQVEFGTRLVRFTGVGNIAGGICAPERASSFVSHNGTAGAELRKVQPFEYPWPKEAVIVLHSDGLATRWHFQATPGILGHRASIIAAGLFREFRRERDDVTVIVLKEP